MTKVYYFRCRECGERKTQDEESFAKPLVCQRCYDLAFDEAEEIAEHEE